MGTSISWLSQPENRPWKRFSERHEDDCRSQHHHQPVGTCPSGHSRHARSIHHDGFPFLNRRDVQCDRFFQRSLSALAMTETELGLMAAPANIGLKSQPSSG